MRGLHCAVLLTCRCRSTTENQEEGYAPTFVADALNGQSSFRADLKVNIIGRICVWCSSADIREKTFGGRIQHESTYGWTNLEINTQGLPTPRLIHKVDEGTKIMRSQCDRSVQLIYMCF